MDPVRVLIADDESIIRDALRDVIDADPRFEVVGMAASGEELRPLAAQLRPDIVLIDVRMPGGGEAAARAVLDLPSTDAGSTPDLRATPPVVIAVSAHTSAAVVAAMLRAGVSGYLTKGQLGHLPDLLARCANGEVVLAVPGDADTLRQLVEGSRPVDAPDQTG